MRCKNCDYALWNLKARACPECGTPFRPDEFEFVPNAVCFCCPHCDQAYYGTTATGHLRPAEFDCVSCAAHLHMNDMVLRPAEGVDEKQAAAEFMPWLERRRLGRFKAWFMTIGRSMAAPMRLMRATPTDGSTLSAWWFASITLTIILFGGIASFFGTMLVIEILDGSRGMDALLNVFAFIGVPPAIFLAGLLLWGLVTHGLLRVTGGTRHTIGRTYQALCFSAGTNIATAIPCFGIPLGFVGLIWWIVSGTLMVAEAQGVRLGRATFATLVFPVLTVLALAAGYMWFVIHIIGLSQTAMATARIQALSGTQSEAGSYLFTTVEAYRSDHHGDFPPHAIMLVEQGYNEGFDFILAETDTFESDVHLGARTLEDYASLAQDERQRMTNAIVESLPRDVIAHRMGDVVFTWHGMDASARDARLWIMLVSPDPDSNAPPGEVDAVTAVRFDGTVESFSTAEFLAALLRQNELRAGGGLAPLPDPASVTHGSPAAGNPARNRLDSD